MPWSTPFEDPILLPDGRKLWGRRKLKRDACDLDNILVPDIFDLLYREYCRARLAKMRRQLLISPERHEVPAATRNAKDAVGKQARSGYISTPASRLAKDHVRVFAKTDAAETWFEKNDPEGVAFEYEVLE